MAYDVVARKQMASPASAVPATGYECVVVDDDPDICRLITRVLSGIGVSSLGLQSASALEDVLSAMHPSVIFLDVALGQWDAVDGIRILGQTSYGGVVQLISGKDPELVGAVKDIGERHGLNMLEPLQKPFRSEHLRQIFERDPIEVPRRPRPQGRSAKVSSDTGAAVPPQIDLAEALAARWLDVAYQPKVDLASNQIVGAEGLARLNHPQHGELGPASFLPSADKDALRGLTEFIVRKAFLDWEVMAASGINLKLAVNTPVQMLLDPALPELVRDPPKREDWPGLIIEVTEGEAVHELDAVSEAATQLRIYNVSLAIDDFGSGYSSFARLKQLPFSELKLDRSFVRNCASDALNAGICRSIIDLAHTHGAVSVAEGVETAHDWSALVRLGCHVGQGFYFGRPMSVGKLLRRVTSLRAIGATH